MLPYSFLFPHWPMPIPCSCSARTDFPTHWVTLPDPSFPLFSCGARRPQHDLPDACFFLHFHRPGGFAPSFSEGITNCWRTRRCYRPLFLSLFPPFSLSKLRGRFRPRRTHKPNTGRPAVLSLLPFSRRRPARGPVCSVAGRSPAAFSACDFPSPLRPTGDQMCPPWGSDRCNAQTSGLLFPSFQTQGHPGSLGNRDLRLLSPPLSGARCSNKVLFANQP